MSINDTIVMNLDLAPITDTVRYNQYLMWQDVNYLLLNRIIAATAATFPLVARATTASQVKTTNATVLLHGGGTPIAFAATDNYWTLTGAVLPVASFRRYLLCRDAAGTASVLASRDSTVSAAACRWSALPPTGTVIAGILTVTTNGATTFTPGVTLLSAAGVTDSYVDGWDINTPRAGLVVSSAN